MNALAQATPFYMGTHVPLTDADVIVAAAESNIQEAHLRAVIEEECAGIGSHSSGAVNCLYEPHVIWRNTSGAWRDALAAEGLAYPNWKRGNYPKTSYPRIDRCVEIVAARHPGGHAAGVEIAARGSSWGLGQILGENAELAGYESATAMVEHFRQSEANQLAGMIGFIRGAGLLGALRRGDWPGFALGYNGKQYAVHNYHGRLADAAAKWAKIIAARKPGDVLYEPPPAKDPDDAVWDREPVQNPSLPVPVPELPDLPEIPRPEGLEDKWAIHAEFMAKLNAREFVIALRQENAARAGYVRDGAVVHVSPIVSLGRANDPSWPTPITTINQTPTLPKGFPMTGIKDVLMSKTLYGIISAAIAIYSPAAGSILNLLGLGGAEMDPAVVSDLKEGLSQLWAGLSLLYAAYGRVVAKDRLKLPFGLGAEE